MWSCRFVCTSLAVWLRHRMHVALKGKIFAVALLRSSLVSMGLQRLAAPDLCGSRAVPTRGVSSNGFIDPRVPPISVIPAVAKSMNRHGPGAHGVPSPGFTAATAN